MPLPVGDTADGVDRRDGHPAHPPRYGPPSLSRATFQRIAAWAKFWNDSSAISAALNRMMSIGSVLEEHSVSITTRLGSILRRLIMDAGSALLS